MNDAIRQHLSQMATSWTILQRAHQGPAEDAGDARRAVLDRYAPAVYRYLLGAVRDRDRADELFQDFALKFLRGDFHRACPERGRFRDYLKSALYHLIVREQTRRRPRSLTRDLPEPAPDPAPTISPDQDEAFLQALREELIHRAWDRLEQRENHDGRPLFTILRFRTDQPELDSEAAAAELSRRLGRPLSAGWVRKWHHLARRQFAIELCDEVAQTLGSADPDPDDLERELQVLGWLDHCRAAVTERRSRAADS